MRTTSNTEHRTILNDPEGKQNVLLQLGTFRPYLPILERMSDGAKAKARSLGVGEGGRTFTDLMLTEKIIAACHVLVAEGENRKLKLEISELQRLQKELEEKARTDSLTGILNRRGFDEVLGRAIAHTKRKDWQDPLQLLFLDLDHFKRVNDESGLGHPAGDQVLREVANRLVAGGREEDVVGRLGGEEFGILLYTNAIKGRQAAIRYLQHIRAGEYVVGMGKNRTRIKQTVSIGGTSLQINDTPAEFVARADRSMYLAKNGAGRGRDQVWYDREYVPEAV